MTDLDLSQYKPTPAKRRFELSSFALKAELIYSGETISEDVFQIAADINITGGAFAKMIPLKGIHAQSNLVFSEAGVNRLYREDRGDGSDRGAEWLDATRVSMLEVPWVIEHAAQMTAGEYRFFFKDARKEQIAKLRVISQDRVDLRIGTLEFEVKLTGFQGRPVMSEFSLTAPLVGTQIFTSKY